MNPWKLDLEIRKWITLLNLDHLFLPRDLILTMNSEKNNIIQNSQPECIQNNPHHIHPESSPKYYCATCNKILCSTCGIKPSFGQHNSRKAKWYCPTCFFHYIKRVGPWTIFGFIIAVGFLIFQIIKIIADPIGNSSSNKPGLELFFLGLALLILFTFGFYWIPKDIRKAKKIQREQNHQEI